MSSVAKGDAFEQRAFQAVNRELQEDRLGLSPKQAIIYRHKGYYSRSRESDIIVDLSIEVWLPGATSWSLLWVCECKDYSGSVPVGDVEEFKAKLDQIAGVNKKGMMVISGAMQSGALNYARSNGIGVIRLLPDDQVHHMIYRQSSEPSINTSRLHPNEVFQAILRPSYIGADRGFFALSDDRVYGDWGSLLRDTIPPESIDDFDS